jgi:uncharacterized membrane protein YeaQ/YmgE (transglycosylase-associated protein family)
VALFTRYYKGSVGTVNQTHWFTTQQNNSEKFMLGLIISLASGAIGGNVAGKILKKFDQGTLVNSIVGILGGGIGGSILSTLTGGAIDSGSADSIGGIISTLASGCVGGGVLLVIVGFVKKILS